MTNAQISNAALGLLAAGDVAGAWAMAQHDTGLLPHVTEGVWLTWARGALAGRVAIDQQGR